MGSNSCSSSKPRKLKFTLSPFLCLLFLFLNVPTTTTTTTAPEILYSQHCNDDFLRFEFAFFSGGIGIFNPTSESGMSLSFDPSYIQTTASHGIHKFKATLYIRDPLKYSVSRWWHLGSIKFWEEDSVFYVNGYWSESSGKLCMVGSGKNYSKVVLKLNYSKNNTIYGSLIDGTLESLHMENDYNYFEPIVIMGLSQNPNYQYQLVDNVSCFSGERGGRDKNNININLSLSKLDNGVCFIFDGRTSVYELEYWRDCGSVNCNPLGGSIRYLPNWIAFRGVRCDQHSRKVQMLMGFPNPSTGMKFEFPGPNATLIAEGAWDEKDNQFCGVACRILANASVGDCSIGLSLRFPAVLSLRNWRSTVGEIWSKKDVNDSECFGRIGFQSWERPFDPQSLRYEYTEIEEVRNSCALGEETIRGKGKSYPDGFSLDMGFDMLVRNTEGKVASGFSRPQFVGDVLYVQEDELKSNHSRMLNMSYRIGFTPPPDFRFGADAIYKFVHISAEGIYDRYSGLLYMIL